MASDRQHLRMVGQRLRVLQRDKTASQSIITQPSTPNINNIRSVKLKDGSAVNASPIGRASLEDAIAIETDGIWWIAR